MVWAAQRHDRFFLLLTCIVSVDTSLYSQIVNHFYLFYILYIYTRYMTYLPMLNFSVFVFDRAGDLRKADNHIPHST